jgi:hypothetical protein
MICSGVYLGRFMVEYSAQSGRMRALIHPGPVSEVHVKMTEPQPENPDQRMNKAPGSRGRMTMAPEAA